MLTLAKAEDFRFAVGKRRESALVMHLNDTSMVELHELLKEFYERLLEFAEAHPDDNEHLCQVLINFTPISSSAREEKS